MNKSTFTVEETQETAPSIITDILFKIMGNNIFQQQEFVDNLNRKATQRIQQFDVATAERIRQAEWAVRDRVEHIENSIKEPILIFILVFKVNALFVLSIFFSKSLTSLPYVIMAASVSAGVVYLERYLKGNTVVLTMCSLGAVYYVMLQYVELNNPVTSDLVGSQFVCSSVCKQRGYY